MNFICSILLVLTFIWQPNQAALNGKCNECNANGAACVNENQFVICLGGQPSNTGRYTTCPEGTICTDEKTICTSAFSGKGPLCYESSCNSCAETEGSFACVDDITYGFCYGALEPNIDSLRQCPFNYVCDLTNPEICSLKGLAKPSCIDPNLVVTTTVSITETTEDTDTTTNYISTTETTTEESSTDSTTTPEPTTTVEDTTKTTESTTTKSTTTESTTTVEDTTTTTKSTTEEDTSSTTPFSTDPNIVCDNVKSVGNFKDELDTTCKKYILCFALSGQYLGQRYSCEGYFNDVIKKCQDNKPPSCI